MSRFEVLAVRFRPNADLWAVLASWVLVTGSLATATFVVGAQNGGYYFIVYAIFAALVFGVGLPTWWMVWHRKRSLADLGVTTRLLGLSIVLQLVFAAVQYWQTLARVTLPAMSAFLPLVALALCIGFFEALFWRGWMLLRLEECFGFIPALLIGSALYALYHIGYGMPWSEMAFLFVIGLLYGAVFRITKNVFILWPLLQPMGQLTTLVRDGSVSLPTIAILGFAEVLLAMFVLLWFAHRHERKMAKTAAPAQAGVTA
jgi:membrane protease YdiL (CAAX protease family)